MGLLPEIENARVHDLVQVDLDSVHQIVAPCWVVQSLRSCPWAVVRRVPFPIGNIAVGVRGDTREKRWGGFIRRDSVTSIVRPMDLLAICSSSTTSPRTPATKVLQKVIERWQDFELAWGPTGSVALELVSGEHITTESSDLDIAIRASSRLSPERARSLWGRVIDLQPNVDVRVEAPECGFSLQEYAYVWPARILLRYRDGVGLGVDPWSPQVRAAGIGV
jgi:phosphoribosyl-dephospho-CoA transferase